MFLALCCNKGCTDPPGKEPRRYLRPQDQGELGISRSAHDGKIHTSIHPRSEKFLSNNDLQEWGQKFPEAKIKKSIENTKLKRLATVEVCICPSILRRLNKAEPRCRTLQTRCGRSRSVSRKLDRTFLSRAGLPSRVGRFGVQVHAELLSFFCGSVLEIEIDCCLTLNLRPCAGCSAS